MKGKAVFICEGVRTPIGRFGGVLSSVRPDDMAAHVINALLDRASGMDGADVDEVIFGCANQAGEDNRNVARMAVLLSGLPVSVPALTVNRLCASGLDAVIAAARSIAVGDAEIVIAGGVESMSRAPYVMGKAERSFERNQRLYDTTIGWRFIHKQIAKNFGTESMPETAENLVDEYAISREYQDAYALRSQQRTAKAKETGIFDEEIAPLEVKQGKDVVLVTEDEHPRETSLEKLAGLQAPFKEGGTITAGNASGINDGAAALIIASEMAVKRFGLKPKARIVASASAGIEPRIMGVGPVAAMKVLENRYGLSVSGFDHIELNEAFAAQVLAVTRTWGLEDDAPYVNPNGGAISLGHPLGMSGTRLVIAASNAIARGKARTALVTLCVGVGQGVALALESV